MPWRAMGDPASVVRAGDCPDHAGPLWAFCPRLPDGLPTHRGDDVGAAIDLWYRQDEATLSDVLALGRRALWAGKYFAKSTALTD